MNSTVAELPLSFAWTTSDLASALFSSWWCNKIECRCWSSNVNYPSRISNVYRIEDSPILLRNRRPFSTGTLAHFRPEYTFHLEKLGYDVEGLDINPDFIEIVEKKVPSARVHLGDMETFQINQKYDVVTCLFSSIGYTKTLDRLESTLKNMRNHLVPGGVLVIEPWYTPETFKPGHFTGTVQDINLGKVARVNCWKLDNGFAVGDSQFLIASSDGIEHIAERHELGLFTNEEYIAALENCGFAVKFDAEGPIGRGLFVGILEKN